MAYRNGEVVAIINESQACGKSAKSKMSNGENGLRAWRLRASATRGLRLLRLTPRALSVYRARLRHAAAIIYRVPLARNRGMTYCAGLLLPFPPFVCALRIARLLRLDISAFVCLPLARDAQRA